MPLPRTGRRAGRRFTLPLLAAGALLAGVTAQGAATAAPGADTPAGHDGAGSHSVRVDFDGYYDDALGKDGAELKAALHGIISDQRTLSYDEVWDALQATDEDPDDPGSVILLYSGNSRSKDAHGGDQDDWNREHVWAKSHGDFGTSPGPGTDVHHLRPTDVTVNGTRGNKDFDNGGSPVDEAPESRTDSDSFEPRDEVKGDVARMILYMAVRYEGDGGAPDLRMNDQVDNGSAPYHGRLSVLKQWHEQDPPDAFEERRNQVIFDSIQNNRNPFVDHPEWVESIW